MNFVKRILRVVVDLDEPESFFTTQTGRNPSMFAGTGVQFDFLFKRGDTIIDVSNLYSLTITVLADTFTGAAFMQATTASFDNTVDAAAWADGTKQHASIVFTDDETDLPIDPGAIVKNYGLTLSGFTTDDTADRDTFGRGIMLVLRDGVPPEAGPVQAGNLIPSGAEYDGSGEYELEVVADTYYKWTQGDNDTSVTNGTETVSATNANFLTQGATVILNGTPGEAVTAAVRKSPYLTADEVWAIITALPTSGPGNLYWINTPGGNPNSVITATRPARAEDELGNEWTKRNEGNNNTGWVQTRFAAQNDT